MLNAYRSSRGDLVERMLAALDAAEAEGGDIRGRQSAGILVVAGSKSDDAWKGRVVDLRVEDHAEPLVELRRLVVLGRSYTLADQAERAASAGDMKSANEKMTDAMRLAPDNVEIAFWAAIATASAGQMDVAKALLARASAKDPRWVDLVRRLQATGMFDLSDETVAALTAD
jgi:uncharacterized Ntn-hydrolase superfamily protein